MNKISDWDKTKHIETSIMLDSYIFGQILKKSQHLKIWKQRYVVIKKEGIYSYRSHNREQNHSFFIPRANIKYIWTRLDFIHKFLVLKVKHGIYQTEFAIPISKYSCRNCKNWLYEFCRMLQ